MASVAIPWVEKYRPKSLSEVSHQAEIVSVLQNSVETNRLPHLLFYGPPGTGKTSVALALCRQLWSPQQYSRRVLELNASDERGISVVRNKIKSFASLAVGDGIPKEKADPNQKKYPNPPFKIIIMDEADAITSDAQAALRRIIEAFSKVTRFVLICNYVTRIIPPLASRCAKFRFQSLPSSSMLERLHSIALQEQCRLKDENEVLNYIIKMSKGDMRRAITLLQSAHSVKSESTDSIEVDDIAEISGFPSEGNVTKLINGLDDGSYASMEKAVFEIAAEGYPATVIISTLLDTLVLGEGSPLDDEDKAIVSVKMAEIDKSLVDGADNLLQLLTLCSVISRRLQAKRNKRKSIAQY